ncbi:MAG: hypothetical protein ABL971_04585 [Vicinamibacterales bacterium]
MTIPGLGVPDGVWNRRMRWGVALAASGAFVATALFRFLALRGFPNDQYEHLAGAQQMLFGEWPTRDFLDPGMPLMYAVSAGAQLLLGRTLLAEAVLNFSMLGLAAACTLVGAHRVSRSLAIAAAVAILSVLIFPRPYAYPRLLLTAVGPLAMWAWTARPTFARMTVLAATVVVAFLFRHDFGAYLGIGALVTLVVAPAKGWPERVRCLATFAGLLLLLITPYALFLGGYGAFANSLLRFFVYGARHVDRNAFYWSQLGLSPEGALLWGCYVMPCAALALLVADRIQRREPREPPVILPLAALAIACNYFLIGNTLVSRLPDAVVPNLLLFAWLVGRATRAIRRPVRRAAVCLAAVVAAIGAASTMVMADIPEQFARTGLSRYGLQEMLARRAGELKARYSPGQMPDQSLLPLVPFFEYLDRCTTTRHRLFVGGYAPQIYVYARRMFGGGEKVFLEGSFSSPADQQFIVDRMRRQVVLFSLSYSDEAESWPRDFPQVAEYVALHFSPLTEVVAPNRTIRISIDPRLPPYGTDARTGWPCFR